MSAIKGMPIFSETFWMSERSIDMRDGLVRGSMKKYLVLEFIVCRIDFSVEKSACVCVIPYGRRTFLRRRSVPPYISWGMMILSPGLSVRKSIASAARPEENAVAYPPPSRAASFSSKLVRVGFCPLEYSHFDFMPNFCL